MTTPASASTSNKDPRTRLAAPPRPKNPPRGDSNGGSSISSARTGSSGSTRGFNKTEGEGEKGNRNESESGGLVVDDVRAMVGTRKDDGALDAREKATEGKGLVEREGEMGREGGNEDDPSPGVDEKKEESLPEEIGKDERRWEEALGDDLEEEDEEDENWLLFNDFRVERTVLEDARGFDPIWKEPCVLVYRRVAPPWSSSDAREAAAAEASVRRVLREHLAIPPSVFDIPVLSKVRPSPFHHQWTGFPYLFQHQ